MPRLNHALYCKRRQFLQNAWAHFPVLYAVLPGADQRRVHAFYATTKELTDTQLRQYRKDISRQQPSLPNTFGKGFARIYEVYGVAVRHAGGDEQKFRNIVFSAIRHYKHQPEKTPDGKRQVTVAAVAKPEIDLERLAKVLIDRPQQPPAP